MIREAVENDKEVFDKLARHPLQSWSWGEFRKQTRVEISRLIQENDGEAIASFQITWHKIPKINRFIGYCPKSLIPDQEVLKAIGKLAKERKAIMVKFEPNEKAEVSQLEKIKGLSNNFELVAGKPLFTKYSFQLDISKNEEALLAGMHQKTRYNLRLAEKKGVRIVEDDSEKGFEEYWQLMEETTKRQGFFAHTKKYHHKMWKTMIGSGEGHLFKAVYAGEILTTWILFELNGVLYYPYGASSNKYREVMANNLMMWEAIKFGKSKDCVLFDLWGSLGTEPDPKDPWYGFHRFKQGYGADLVEFVGSYDMVSSHVEYQIYKGAESLRWVWLKLIAKLRK